MRLSLMLIQMLVLGAITGSAPRSARSEPSPSENIFPELRWEVLDQFRMLPRKGDTEDLFHRFEYYQAYVYNQDNSGQMLPTAWDPAEGRYRKDYLTVKSWRVRMSTSVTGRCSWRVGSRSPERGLCEMYDATVDAGETPVVVTPLSDSTSASIRQTIVPRDVLFVTLGDSYASGEGVPDLRHGGFWGLRTAKWTDQKCHRSLFAGPSLAALFYARLHPHVSVTHLTFACSGAEMNAGLLAAYSGAEPHAPGPEPIPQIQALKAALVSASRSPDFVTISIGGNDLGFGHLVESGLYNNAHLHDFIDRQVPANITAIGVRARELKKSLDAEPRVMSDTTKILITEYPNPTRLLRNQAGERFAASEQVRSVCGRVRRGTIGFLPSFVSIVTNGNLDLNDWAVSAFEGVSAQLNGAVTSMADVLGGEVVNGIRRDFEVHGYCASGLNVLRAETRWINTVVDADQLAGLHSHPELLPMHPNIRGQAAIGRRILEKIVDLECRDASKGKDPPNPCRERQDFEAMWRWRD